MTRSIESRCAMTTQHLMRPDLFERRVEGAIGIASFFFVPGVCSTRTNPTLS